MTEYLTTAQIAERYGVKRETVTDKWTKRPDFPKPAVRISRRTVMWRPVDVDSWAAMNGHMDKPKPTPPEFPIAEFMFHGLSAAFDARSKAIERAKTAFHRARRRAAANGLKFELCLEDVSPLLEAQDYRCAVSGREFSFEPVGPSKLSPYAPSLDRIDSARGYEIDNIRWVCVAVNFMMNQWGDEVFRSFAGPQC
jgi:predicted DNA-binding transcriptional regulator AlpA